MLVVPLVLALVAEPHRMRSRRGTPFGASSPQPAQSQTCRGRRVTNTGALLHHASQLTFGTFNDWSPHDMWRLSPDQHDAAAPHVGISRTVRLLGTFAPAITRC